MNIEHLFSIQFTFVSLSDLQVSVTTMLVTSNSPLAMQLFVHLCKSLCGVVWWCAECYGVDTSHFCTYFINASQTCIVVVMRRRRLPGDTDNKYHLKMKVGIRYKNENSYADEL